LDEARFYFVEPIVQTFPVDSSRTDSANERAVGNIKTVLRFAWKYMRPYWKRMIMGILLGWVCGATAGTFILAAQTLGNRLLPPKAAAVADNSMPKGVPKPAKMANLPILNQRLVHWKNYLGEAIDPWLPKADVGMDWKRLLGGLLVLPLLALVRGASDYASSYCTGWVSERVVNDLRCDILEKLTSLSLDYFNRSTTGDMFTRLSTDTMNLHRVMRQGSTDLPKEVATMLTAFGVLLWLDWQLTLFAFFLVPVIVLPLFILGKKARRAGREGRKANVGQSSLLGEALHGIRVVKAFNLEARQIRRFREFSKKLIHHGMKGVQAKEMVNPILEVVSAAALGGLVVYLFWRGQSLGNLMGFIGGVIFFFTPIKKIAAVHILFEQASIGVERIVEIMAENPTVVEPANPKPLKNFEREIVFDNVSFSYGNELVVRDLTLRIPRGMKVGIAGESGSGKSTLVNLLYRFYDVTSGSIKIDGIDVRELSFEDLRRPMALVSQDVFVFRTSVAENIAAGRIGATREEIEAAGRAAHANEFIVNLPGGYDSVIGERGMTLSGGQRARLAIARAFVRNAPVLVLDEATASLDSQTEQEVQKQIDSLEENRTVISVAHRLSTLASMDLIIVLAKGRIVEQGKFDDLLRAKGIFARMAARQGIYPAE
jgi:subfamily B ATP-binding cassette protein MsbA